jgi:hypothetical protein
MTTPRDDAAADLHCRLGHLVPRSWRDILDIALILWIVRVPLCAVIMGFLLLDYAPQAQDLLVEFADDNGGYQRMALFLFLVILVWAGTTHYAARLLLDSDERFRALADMRGTHHLTCVERWIPRLLGIVPFVVILAASERSIWNLPDVDDPGVIAAVKFMLRVFDVLVLISLLGFLAYMVKRKALSNLALVRRAEAFARRVNLRLQRFRLSPAHLAEKAGLQSPDRNLGPLLLVVVFLISAAILLLGADRVAEWLPRALVVPIILGGWLPLLTYLSGVGRHLKAPLILAAVAVIVVLSTFLGDNHSVRRIDAAEIVGRDVELSPMTLNDAIDLWMKENGCAADPSRCPRPIIIAAAGGASRAGFFTASIVGQLLDQAHQHGSAADGMLDEGKMRKRIFAISGVSGGAVGAAMTVAALARAGATTKQPCAKKAPLWYGADINGWRDCLEALMAGDFLTPIVIGLIFHDNVRFGWWRDRAALLERSWERRFTEVMQANDRGHWQGSCPGDLRCPFMMLRPRDGFWLPVLVLNGTSAATGGRILTTILAPDYSIRQSDCPTRGAARVKAETKDKAVAAQTYAADPAARECPIFLESTRFHTLLDNGDDPDIWGAIQRLFLWDYLRSKLSFIFGDHVPSDIRLSTAAHNSARFPIVSPPGAIRNRKYQVVDRIVDGGYIENYGALSAAELAQAMHAAQPDLAPFVLVISNDPDEEPDLNKVDVPDAVVLTDVLIPIEAIANARTGRGRLAVQQLNAALDQLTKTSCGPDTAHIRVWPQYRQPVLGGSQEKTSRPVSMSWWMSSPIQIHLHQQTEGGKNQNKNQDEIAKVWQATEAISNCMPRSIVGQ